MTDLKISNLTANSLKELDSSEMKQIVGGDSRYVPDIDLSNIVVINTQIGINVGIVVGNDYLDIGQSIDNGAYVNIYDY